MSNGVMPAGTMPAAMAGAPTLPRDLDQQKLREMNMVCL